MQSLDLVNWKVFALALAIEVRADKVFQRIGNEPTERSLIV